MRLIEDRGARVGLKDPRPSQLKGATDDDCRQPTVASIASDKALRFDMLAVCHYTYTRVSC